MYDRYRASYRGQRRRSSTTFNIPKRNETPTLYLESQRVSSFATTSRDLLVHFTTITLEQLRRVGSLHYQCNADGRDCLQCVVTAPPLLLLSLLCKGTTTDRTSMERLSDHALLSLGGIHVTIESIPRTTLLVSKKTARHVCRQSFSWRTHRMSKAMPAICIPCIQLLNEVESQLLTT
jgi:hypothetical protein